ncbi:MAG: endonuclease/exonuclease/phosphatase family protein [Bacteroidetes bacterium]|nr:endonuclease/exonuclease/phosphatase family protein [Bacteroidota bacterium]
MQYTTSKLALLYVIFSLPLFSLFAQMNPSLKVMTFNLRLNTPQDGENAWPNRKEMVQSMIRFHQADIFGVQEALESQMVDLKQMFPDFQAFGVPRSDDPASGEYSAIFYRKNRFTRTAGETFWLSESPEMASRGWDAALNRIVTWVKLKDRKSGKEFFHFNTHFDHQGREARENSARLILDMMKELNPDNLPIILTGDFNLTPSEDPYYVLTRDDNGNSFHDAIYESIQPHHGPESTWSGFSFPGEPNRRIDYIFVKNNITVLSHAILSDSWSGKYPSDHLPVLAEVLIDPAQPLPRSHAHNDYEHTKPLFDALSHGYMSIEADLWLIDEELYVAHNRPFLTNSLPTFKELYLSPLADLIDKNRGWVYPGHNKPVQLLIDLKSDGLATYLRLASLLNEYDYLFKGIGNNPAPVEIVISGNRPIEHIKNEQNPLVGIDGRPEQLGEQFDRKLMPLISQKYSIVTNWKGKDPIPEEEKNVLKTLIDQVHRMDKKIRLWDIPDNELVWKTLLDLGIDYINVDDLGRFEKFMRDYEAANSR